MSAGFKAVQWNARKYVYDAILIAGVDAVHRIVHDDRRAAQSAGRSAGLDRPAHQGVRHLRVHDADDHSLHRPAGAARSPRFLPLLYNRRHFGVLTFLVALVHAVSVVDWFSSVGAMGDLVTEMTNNPKYMQFIGFPMKALGLFGLSVLFLLAATSHDFWLAFLTPRIWKALHMALYLAYGVLVMHVSLGVMQEDQRIHIPILLGLAFATVTGLHLAAAWRERQWEARRAIDLIRTTGSRSARRTRSPTNARVSSWRRTASASRCSATATRSAR